MTADPNRTPLINMSPAWRYSLKQLLLATSIVAVGCVALRNASSAWVAAMFGLTFVVLGGASLCAVFRDGHRRAFWIGFAACGWLYVMVLMYGWSLDPNSVPLTANPLASHRLATTKVTTWAHHGLFPVTSQQISAQAMNMPEGGFLAAPSGATVVGTHKAFGARNGPTTIYLRYGPDPSEFANVAHALWTLLIALCGGWFARWIYASGPRGGTALNAQPEVKADRMEYCDDR
jgi:hypothetical protein